MNSVVKLDPQELDTVAFQEASLDIWSKKYRLTAKDGSAIDKTMDETYKRVARALAEVEPQETREHWYERFLWALRRGAIPAGRIISNAGAWEHKPATSTINCTVSGTIHDSMDDILRKVHEAGLTLKAGCGIGYEHSTLRPRGAYVSGAGAYTSGPLSFMDIFDKMCFTVSSAGGRRGAQMGTFDVGHPDAMEFIRAKRESGRLRQFNLSLLITDEFMQAVRENRDWKLAFPIGLKEYESEQMDLQDPAKVSWREWPVQQGYVVNEEGLVACKVYKTLPARRMWDVIMASTYDFAEPGFILIDRVNEMNNNWWCENIRATNPCGEQPLPPYGSCWTGSMRLNTNHGLIRTVDAYALVQKGEQLAVAVDHTFSKAKTDLRPCTLVCNGEREVFEVAFDNGQRIELTADHRVFTPLGWREVKELASGDRVCVQSREMASLGLVEPFYLGALKYLLPRHEGEEIRISRRSRRAFLKPILDLLRVHYTDGRKGLLVSRNHPVVREVERCDLEDAPREVLEGYAYAADATSAKYKGCKAICASRQECDELASVLARLGAVSRPPAVHGRDRYRLILPALEIHAPAPQRSHLDLEYALYGWLLADGWLTDSAGLLFSDQDDVAMRMLAPQLKLLTGTAGELRETHTGHARNAFSIAGYRKDAIGRLRAQLGLDDCTSKNLRVPERVFRASVEQQASFLAAVFCAAGSVAAEEPLIELVSPSRRWLQDIQLMLLSFGVHGTIHSSVSRGEVRHTLLLQQRDCHRFHRYIGFPLNSSKHARLGTHLACQQRQQDLGDECTARVGSIRSLGVQKVYDIEESSTHTLIVNGVVVHNCLLGSVNLTRFVRHPFTEFAEFDWAEYRDVVKVFTRMLDNVVEVNGLPLEKQREEILRKRRHGMGFLGLGSTITLLGMKYGAPESVKFTEDISREMAVAGWEAALELAREKGPAPIMNEEFTVTREMLRKRPEMARDGWKPGAKVPGRLLHARYSRYMQRIAAAAPQLVHELAEVGARFTHHTSIAPTGTISLSLANNASNGIEPSFAHHYFRNVIREGKKSKEKVDVYSFELLAYREIVNPKAKPDASQDAEKLPDYFIASDAVTPEQHVNIQAAAQKWVDSSISKTANVPTDFPYEKFKDIYMYAYEQGLKGCTTFRFNPAAFQGVLVKEQDLKNTVYRFTLEDGTVVEARGDEEVEYDGETHTAANLYDAMRDGYYGRF
ncbi:MAG TPA: ribonucleotide reductase N-terminal alpha domain-containing protein [Steroidobacteraceae bacterium]|nr:ribonucleotide reductase N-terminal alpha domain-containing protein [Steroidobacteraceae bacterium]